MTLLVTSLGDVLLGNEEAKRHLRILTSDHDDELTSLVKAATDDCERWTARTLRASTTRTWKTDSWWCGPWRPPFPPLLGITSITYYDTDNSEQTLSSSNYSVLLSTDGFGEVHWAYNATLPSLYDRPDAITATFTTGYASLEAMPPTAVQAIKVRLSELLGAGSESETKAAVECANRLLGKVDCTGYA